MESVEKAKAVLLASSPGRIEREELVAYATLEAYCSHFPEQSSSEDRDLLAKWKQVPKQEYSRFLKQRRIALAKLAREWHSES